MAINPSTVAVETVGRMDSERAFILGVALGVAGSLIPDVPSAIIMHKETPEVSELIWIVYGMFALIVIVTILEVSK